MNIMDFLKMLNYDEFSYFYHETSSGVGKRILERGLLVDGTNILDVENIAFTTIAPLTPDLTETPEQFVNFVQHERSSSSVRDVSEMVIICTAKNLVGDLVESYDKIYQGNFFEGIIRKHHILGVIDMETLSFEMNEEFEYAGDLVDSDIWLLWCC